MKAILSKVLAFLNVIGDIPNTTVDDTLREILTWLVGQSEDNPVLEYIAVKADMPEGALSIEADPPDAVAEALAAKGINWGSFAQLLPFIIQLINLFRGK